MNEEKEKYGKIILKHNRSLSNFSILEKFHKEKLNLEAIQENESSLIQSPTTTSLGEIAKSIKNQEIKSSSSYKRMSTTSFFEQNKKNTENDVSTYDKDNEENNEINEKESMETKVLPTSNTCSEEEQSNNLDTFGFNDDEDNPKYELDNIKIDITPSSVINSMEKNFGNLVTNSSGNNKQDSKDLNMKQKVDNLSKFIKRRSSKRFQTSMFDFNNTKSNLFRQRLSEHFKINKNSEKNLMMSGLNLPELKEEKEVVNTSSKFLIKINQTSKRIKDYSYLKNKLKEKRRIVNKDDFKKLAEENDRKYRKILQSKIIGVSINRSQYLGNNINDLSVILYDSLFY